MADGKPADKAKDADRAAHLNIFSDDGSFLERFKLLKGEEDAKKKNEASLRRKRDWEEALKNRKKRAKKADDADGPSGGTKAADGDTKAAPYVKMVSDAEKLAAKEAGSGVRPLMR